MTFRLKLNRRKISHKFLLQVLFYDKNTGLFTWKTALKKTSASAVGATAGFISKEGYVIIKLLKRKYKAHRLAWFYVHGIWPDNEIDHENNNPSDNKWVNLRQATHAQNTYNRKKHKNNKSGYKGVSYCKRDKLYIASISINGKVTRLGYFKDPKQASMAYNEAALANHGKFAKF